MTDLEIVANLLSQHAVHLAHVMFQQGSSLTSEIDRRVACASADYTETHMKRAIFYKSREPVHRYTANQVKNDGLFLEFGVWRGESINRFAEIFPDKTLYGFDSFEGLMEDWAGTNMAKGTFSLDGNKPPVLDNVVLTQGWFHETLPKFLAEHPEPIAFLHVDGDTYEAAEIVFRLAGDRLVPGSIVLFDEYINYRGWEFGEFKAWREVCDRLNIRYEYLCFATEGQQVSVRVTSVG